VAKVKLLPQNDARRRLDRYELIGEIAAGGMAAVFLARLGGVGGFQRFVAIKRLHPHLATEPEFVEMFLDEARLAAGIHHPNVVPILEVGTSESGYYLVMEYIEGDTLARVVARALSQHEGASVPRPILMRIVLDALAGLAAAHDLCDARGRQVGLVHRDVSPQNILVGIDGTSRLTDFGVARATSRLSSTRAGKLKGKLAYMAPEQTKNVAIDRRADLFAMGIILWEVLTGRRLFKADSEAITLARLLTEPIPSPRQIAPDVPVALDAVCAHALERDPARRFQTATEMADALERAARDHQTAGGELGLARPRDVAEYVQRIIGQEIAEQRDNVRAWLAQSEPSQSVRGEPGKHAADVHVATVEAEPDEPSKPEITGRISLDLPPDTTRGIGPTERQPASGRTLPGILPPTPIPAMPHVPSEPAPVLSAQAARIASDEDGEPTQVRSHISVSPPGMTLPGDDAGAPASMSEPLSVPQPPLRRSSAPMVFLLLTGLAALAGGALWLRSQGDASPETGAPARAAEAPAAPVESPAAPPAATTTAADPIASSSAAAPTGGPATTTSVADLPDARPGSRPSRGAVGPPPSKPAATTKPVAPSKPTAAPAAPAAAPSDELTNPYR
jgi:serine/threonine-protein kinase